MVMMKPFLKKKRINIFKSKSSVISILHSGSLQSGERNPQAFLTALAKLVREKEILPGSLKVTFRASGNEYFYKKMVASFGLDELVYFEPAVSYKDATVEIIESDILLLMQGSLCSYQIPAKTYEYLYARRPLLALTDPRSDTGNLLRDLGYSYVVDIDDVEGIMRNLLACIAELRSGHVNLPELDRVQLYSRRRLAGSLAKHLDSVLDERSINPS